MSISESEFETALGPVRQYIIQHGSIRNSELRELTGLDYDQAIRFFYIAVSRRFLQRVGRYSGTRYILTEDATRLDLPRGPTNK